MSQMQIWSRGQRVLWLASKEALQLFKFSPTILKMGYPLSSIMELSPHIFDGNYITTVRYGEIYGVLDETLEKWLD